MPDEYTEGSGCSEYSKRVDRLAGRLVRLSDLQLSEVERLVNKLEMNANSTVRQVLDGGVSEPVRNWPHAPLHRLSGKGTFIVTASTLEQEHFFDNKERLTLLESQLLSKAVDYNWQLEAWAVFSNHYHFVGHALEDAKTLKPFLSDLHAKTVREINRMDKTGSRRIWFNFFWRQS